MEKLKEKDRIGELKNRTIQILKENYVIIILLLLSLFLHLVVLKKLGVMYNVSSDDTSYIRSGIHLAKTGELIMHEKVSAQIMPGLSIYIAIFSLIFGEGELLYASLKISYIILSLLTMLIVYKTSRMYINKWYSIIPVIFFFSLDYIWMDNVILTETPFLLLFTLIVYYSLKLGEKINLKDYIALLVFYIIAVFIRPNIGILPIFIFLYLWIAKKNNFWMLFKYGVIAGVILFSLLVPWTIRNYKLFNKFIPLTYGVGNPKLLGTYQGFRFPRDEELNYVKDIDEKLPKEVKEGMERKDYLRSYYILEYDNIKAKYRMKKWWEKDKLSMIISYTIYKPYHLLLSSFYWETLLGIPISYLLIFRKIEFIVFLLALILVLKYKKHISETIFLLSIYTSQIIIYSMTFSFSRYAITMFFIRYIIIAFGISAYLGRDKKILEGKELNKDEDISNNSML